jgi:hypothetical protein
LEKIPMTASPFLFCRTTKLTCHQSDMPTSPCPLLACPQ